MRLDFPSVFEGFAVRECTAKDAREILALHKSNPHYFQRTKTPSSLQSVTEDTAALPKGKTYADEYFPGFYRDGALKAILDLVANYPCAGTAFIGWFDVARGVSARGRGCKMHDAAVGIFETAEFLRVRFFGA